MFVVRQGSHRKATEVEIDFGGTRVVFGSTFQVGGMYCMLAELDERLPNIDALVANIERLPRYRVTAEDPRPGRPSARSVGTPPLLSPVPQARSEADLHADAATVNGWSALDQVGTDNGGRSKTTGLTLVELALARAPATWDADRDVCWPWQLPGWRGPGLTWKPPRIADKPGWAARVGRVPVEDEVVSVPPKIDSIPDGGNEADDDAHDPDHSDAGFDEPREETDIPDVDDMGDISEVLDLSPDEMATLETYGSAEHRTAALAVVRELMKDGSTPSRQRLNYFLVRKTGLPSCSEAQLAVLIRAANLT